jgi:hypothetical protein
MVADREEVITAMRTRYGRVGQQLEEVQEGAGLRWEGRPTKAILAAFANQSAGDD